MVDIPFFDLDDVLRRVEGLLNRAIGRLDSAARNALSRVLSAAEAATEVGVSRLRSALQTGIDNVTSVVDSLAGRAGDAFDSIASSVISTIDNMVSPIVTRITSFVDAVIGGVRSIGDSLRQGIDRVAQSIDESINFLRVLPDQITERANRIFADLQARTLEGFDRLMARIDASLQDLGNNTRAGISTLLQGLADQLTLPTRLLTSALDSVGLGLDDIVVVLADVVGEGLAELTAAVIRSSSIDIDEMMDTIGRVLNNTQQQAARIGQELAAQGDLT